MAAACFGYFGTTKGVNLITVNSQGWSIIFTIDLVFIIFLF